MRTLLNTRVVHLESTSSMQLLNSLYWLQQDSKKHPENKLTNDYKVKLIRLEVNKR